MFEHGPYYFLVGPLFQFLIWRVSLKAEAGNVRRREIILESDDPSFLTPGYIV
jgi:hypothetical protein